MLTIDDVTDDATARQWFREQWRRPEFVAEMLGDAQYTALAGVLRYPELIDECTAHIFATDDGLLLDAFKACVAARREPNMLYGVTTRMKARRWPWEAVEVILKMLEYPPSLLGARDAIEKAQKIVAWKYQQEKKTKCKI